jgi:PST family polysaccharide transporter
LIRDFGVLTTLGRSWKSAVSTNTANTENREQGLPAAGLGTHSARALVYFFGCSTASKVIGFLAQLVLLYLLGRQDFGVVTLACTITAFIQVIAQNGVQEVLIRQRTFRLWAVPAFWLALALGVVSSVLVLLGAPFAAWMYARTPEVHAQLFWSLIILAPSPLGYALMVVPQAQLLRELRFQTLATINLILFTLQNVLTVVFAALGFGAYSFVWPMTISVLITMAIFWWWVRPHWAPRPQIRRWRYMLSDSTSLLVGEYGRLVVDQSDYVLLGLFTTVPLVGIYTVGYRVAIQALQMIMTNMASILFPTFMKLADRPQKQLDAFINVQRILTTIGVSSCLLQAAVSEPFAKFAFPSGKWDPSIVVMQVLSIGMATRMVGGAASALMKSQGRFRIIRLFYWLHALTQVALLTLVLSLGGEVLGVSVVVGVLAALAGPLCFYLALRWTGNGWRTVADVMTRPTICGSISVGVAWMLGLMMDRNGYSYLSQLIVITAVAVALNMLLAWAWMRPVWDDFWLRVKRLLPGRAMA